MIFWCIELNNFKMDFTLFFSFPGVATGKLQTSHVANIVLPLDSAATARDVLFKLPSWALSLPW